MADNRLAEIGGGWNEELLKLEIDFLKESDFDIDLTGFDIGKLEQVEKINSSDESSEWVGMPEFDIKDKPFQIIISCEKESDMVLFAEQHNLKFKKKQEKVWSTIFPWKENDDLKSVKYE